MKLNNNFKTLAMQAAGVSGGSIAANMLRNQLTKLEFIPESFRPYAAPAASVVGGILIADKLGKKKPFLQSVGVGMAARGLQLLIGQVGGSNVEGIISGMNPFDRSNSIGETYYVNLPTQQQPEKKSFNDTPMIG